MATEKERHEALKEAVRELLDKTSNEPHTLLAFSYGYNSHDEMTALRGRLARLSGWNG